MRGFRCFRCGELLFFENSVCLNCGADVAFDRRRLELIGSDGSPLCANLHLAECNWIVDRQDAAAEGPAALCFSCKLTRTRPADSDRQGMAEFAAAETSKRRLIYQLLDIGLPINSDLHFDLLSSEQAPVITGQDNGVITIDLAEADDAQRESRREDLHEPYRTMLGNFRHEIGHYYEPILVDQTHTRDRYRALFGDERADYQAALDRHYQDGPPADWVDEYVSAYATMHPYEDWAETFANYLDIADTLETAAAYGVGVDAPLLSLFSQPAGDLAAMSFAEMLDRWLPLTYALNQVTRAMGEADLYPFVLAPKVVQKLTFVHDRIRQGAEMQSVIDSN